MRGRLLRLLAWLSRQFARAASLLGYGVAGLMRSDQLRRTIQAEWDDYGRSGWASYPNLGAWESEFYLKHIAPGERVLLVGCGTGRDLLGLWQAGLHVDGLDIAKRAIATCRERVQQAGVAARLYDCAVEAAVFDARYDAALFTWFGYGYIPESRARVRTLQALHAALRSGGRVLLTYQLAASGTSRLPVGLGRLLGWLSRSGWRLEPGDYVEVTRGAGGDPALHFEHRFTPHEVVAEAHAAGFRMLAHEQAAEGRAVLVRD